MARPKKTERSGPKTQQKGDKPLDFGENRIEPPAFLSDTAREFWFEYIDELMSQKLITNVDVPAFAGFCQNMAIVSESQDAIDEDGIIIDDERGSKKSNPAVGIQNRAWQTALKFAQEFGLTPKSRRARSKPAGGGQGGTGSSTAGGSGSSVSPEARRARLFPVAN